MPPSQNKRRATHAHNLEKSAAQVESLPHKASPGTKSNQSVQSCKASTILYVLMAVRVFVTDPSLCEVDKNSQHGKYNCNVQSSMYCSRYMGWRYVHRRRELVADTINLFRALERARTGFTCQLRL